MNLDSPHFLQKLFTLRMVLFASLQNHHAKSCDSSPNCLRRAPLLPRIVANFGARRVLTHSLKAR